MPGKNLKISRRVRLDIVCERLYGRYVGELDCRLLFLGDHYRQLLRAYEEIVYRFSTLKAAALVEGLTSSAEIQQFYEVRQDQGTVSVLLRDSVFRAPGPVDQLHIELKISDGKRVLFYPLPLGRMPALGQLLPLLGGDHTEAEMALALEAALSSDDARWAGELIAGLKQNGFLERGPAGPNHFLRSASRPRLTFMGHTSLLLQSERSAVLIDPVLRANLGLPRAAFDVTRLKLGAVCCTHGHWDHCDLQTLMWFDKSIPLLIPKVERPSAFNPPMREPLRRLGFTDIREVRLWEPIWIDDIELIPVPFHGEQDEPGAEIDHYTYVVKTGGFALYGGADCFRDTVGEMKPVMEKIRDRHQPVMAFLPVSKMVYEYRHGGVNGFCRYVDERLLDQSFQYTAGAEDAARWLAVLGARWVAPYATFNFPRWYTPKVVSDLGRELRRAGLGERLYPMRPLDSLGPSDLNGGLSSKLRRHALVAWFHIGGAVSRLDRRLQAVRLYRLFRLAARRLVFG
jgi:L-ascorbate metabolism protein UlaG (beta-lactamase superfamily)